MPLYKVIDETTIEKFNNSYVILDGNIYINPKDEVVFKAGYKPLKETEQPMFDAETEKVSLTFRDDGENIVCDWTVKEK